MTLFPFSTAVSNAEEALSSLFPAGSNVDLPGLLADPETQDFLARMQACDAGDSSAVPPVCADAGAGAGAGAAPLPADDEGGAHKVPRVASLDFIRAFLTARHACDPAAPAPPPALTPGDSTCSAGDRAEPACSSAETPLPGSPVGAAAAAAAAAFADGGFVASPPAGMPPAMLAAVMHGGAGLPPLPLPLAVVPLEAFAPGGGSGGSSAAAAVPTLPTSTAGAGYSSRGGGGGASTGRAAAAAGANPGGINKAELRRQRRMVSNRESARRSRKRKAEQLGELEGRLHEAQVHLEDALARMAKMGADLAKRDAQVAALRADLDTLRRQLPGRAAT